MILLQEGHLRPSQGVIGRLGLEKDSKNQRITYRLGSRYFGVNNKGQLKLLPYFYTTRLKNFELRVQATTEDRKNAVATILIKILRRNCGDQYVTRALKKVEAAPLKRFLLKAVKKLSSLNLASLLRLPNSVIKRSKTKTKIELLIREIEKQIANNYSKLY